MTRALCLALALAQAQPALTPSADFEQRELEVDKLRTKATGLRLGAGLGYGLALLGACWVTAELIAVERSKNMSTPLSGRGYVVVVPPLAMILGALVSTGLAITLHAWSSSFAGEADEEEQSLAKDRRASRRLSTEDK